MSVVTLSEQLLAGTEIPGGGGGRGKLRRITIPNTTETVTTRMTPAFRQKPTRTMHFNASLIVR